MLIEVKLQENLLLLPYDDDSTVGQIILSAIAEYRKLNLKNAPQKILCARDSKGRILSSGLKIVQHNIDKWMEVVVEEYSDKDLLGPQEIDNLYRDWQLWTLAQVKEHVQVLSVKIVPTSPERIILDLLNELSLSPSEKTQLACVKVYQLLLTKFPDKKLVMEAASKICGLFTDTKFPEVAVCALESFKGLSPLQFKLFDGIHYIQTMYDVQHNLLRFSAEYQGILFAAFEAISGLIGDDELASVINKVLSPGKIQAEAPVLSSAAMNDLHYSPAREKSVSLIVQDAVEEQKVVSPAVKPQPRRINLSRLESLLSSDDQKVRLYGLEKLYGLLSGATKHFKDKPVVPPLPMMKAPASPPPAPEPKEDAGDVFRFGSEHEVIAISQGLLRCLKRSIHGRSGDKESHSAARHQKAGKDGSMLPGGDSAAGPEKGREGDRSKPVAKRSAKDDSPTAKLSTAARLILAAFESPQTHMQSVYLIVDCLWLLLHFPVDIPLDTVSHTRHSLKARKYKISNTRLSNIQVVFASCAREWYRLLLTLAHADELGDHQLHGEVAEKCAYFFSLIVIHGMAHGWRDAGVKLELEAMHKFLCVPKPNYRLFLGLTYIAHLTAKIVSSHRSGKSGKLSLQQELVSDFNNMASEPVDILTLKEILLHEQHKLLKSLWWWSIGERSSHRARLLAMECIAEVSIFGEINRFLLKLEPIPKLIELLSRAVRHEGREKLFDVHHKHSAPGDHGDAHGEDESDSEKEWSFHMDEEDSEEEQQQLYEEEEESDNDADGSDNRQPYRYRQKVVLRPDIQLIRHVLKTISNLLNALVAMSTSYSMSYHQQIATLIRDVHIGDQTNRGVIRLSRIAKRDEVVNFYYTVITNPQL